MTIRPIHRDDARSILWGFGVVVILCVVGAVGMIVQGGGALPGKSYTYVNAVFDNVGTLNPQKQVKEHGLPVGIVSGISYQGGHALVTIRLDGNHSVYADATASIANGNALGKKFINFEPGTSAAGPLPNNLLTAKQTSAGQSFEDILSVFDPQTRTALRSTLNQLGTGLAGHGGDLHAVLAAAPRLLKDFGAVSEAVTSSSADLPGVLASANTLVSRFNGREAQIAGLMNNADATLKAIDVGGGQPIATTVAELPGTLTDAKAALDALGAPLTDAHVALTTLRPGLVALGEGTPALRSFLRTSPSALNKLTTVDGLALPAVADLTTTIAVARPIVAPLQRTVASLDELLYGLAPYAGDVGHFFTQDALLSGTVAGDPNKHYFAAALTAVGISSLAGVPDPLYRGEAYPCPGTAWNHATVTNCSGGVR